MRRLMRHDGFEPLTYCGILFLRSSFCIRLAIRQNEDVRRRRGKEAEERAHGRRTRGRGKAPTTRWLMTGERGRHGDEASKEDDDHDGEHAETTMTATTAAKKKTTAPKKGGGVVLVQLEF